MAISGSKIGSAGGAGLGFAIGGPLGAAIGSFAGGILGGLFDEGPDVQAYINEMAKLYADIVPPDLAKAIVYAQYKQGGKLTPQQLSQLPEEVQPAIQLRESPEFKQKQMAQLQQLEQLAQTGMGPQEILALEQSRRAAASDAQARLKSILQQYQQMGQAGGGASLAASLEAAQSADDREAMMNMQAASMAAENRRNAIQQAFSAASGMRQQDLAVNQYNTENLRQKQMFDIQNATTRQQINAQYANQANMYNLQRQQQVMDMNMQQLNQELYRQQYLAPQQMFANQMSLANAQAGVLAQKAGLAQQQAQAQAQSDMNFMTGLGQIGMGMASHQQNQQLLDQMAKNKIAAAAPAVAQVSAPDTGSVPGFSMPEFGSGFVRPEGRAFNLGFDPSVSGYSMPQLGSQFGQPIANQFNLGYSQQMGMGGMQAGQPFALPNFGYRPFK
jgi:hypothetical protein